MNIGIDVGSGGGAVSIGLSISMSPQDVMAVETSRCLGCISLIHILGRDRHYLSFCKKVLEKRIVEVVGSEGYPGISSWQSSART